MPNDVTIARLRIDGRHIMDLTSTLDDALLAAHLRSAGVEAKLYSGKPEGRIVDLARQLARMRSTAYLFHVSAETAAATTQLAGELKRIRTNVAVLRWTDGADPARGANAHDAPIAADDVADAARKVADLFPGRSATASRDRPFSAYIDKILPAEDARRLGLTAKQKLETLVAELEWLDKSLSRSDEPIFVDAAGSGPQVTAETYRILMEAASVHAVTLRIKGSDWSDALSRRDGVTDVRLRIEGPLDAQPEALEKAGLAFIQAPDHSLDADARSATYARNGYIANRTGLYFEPNASAGIAHLEVSFDLPREKRRAAYHWAANDLNIRSAAVLDGPLALALDHLSDLEGPDSKETAGWPKHVYAAAHGGPGTPDRLLVDGSPAAVAVFRTVPLADYDEQDVRVGELKFVTVRTTEDIRALEAVFSRLHEDGVIRQPHPSLAVHIENSCRWLNHGACRLPLMRRLQVDREERLMSCRDAGVVGAIGDSYEQIVLDAKQLQQIKTVDRGCATCPVRDECSQCVHLPEAYEGRYCAIRKASPKAALLFEVRGFLHLIAGLLPPDQNHFDVTVSGEGLPLQLYKGPTGARPAGTQPLFLGVGNSRFAWWRGTRRLSRLSDPLVLMAEGWWSGAGREDMCTQLASRFGVDLDLARSSLEEGLGKLHSGGVINA